MKRTKYITFAILTILIGTIVISSGFSTDLGEELPILRAWNLVRATEIEVNLNAYGKINDKFSEEEDITAALTRVASYLGLKATDGPQFSRQLGYLEGHIVLQPSDKTVIDLVAQTMGGEADMPAETSLVVNITSIDQPSGVFEFKKRLERYFADVGYDIPVNYTLMGVIEHLSNNEEVTQLINDILIEMQAETKDFYIDENVTSISATTKKLPANPYGWEANFHLALRKINEQDKYRIWLGWPLLGQSY